MNLEICEDNGIGVVRLSGLTIKARKSDGERFLSAPSQKMPDGKYKSHFDIFGFRKDDEAYNTKQKASTNDLTTEVLRILDAGGTQRRAPAGAAAVPAAIKAPEAWDL